MHNVKLVVRVVNDGRIAALYVRQLELPFVPALGMSFQQGISTRMWETEGGMELMPQVEQVIYHVDDEELLCLFTIDQRLGSTFWQEEDLEAVGDRYPELRYFRDGHG